MNRALPDEERRNQIFGGAFFLYTAPPEGLKLLEWARSLIGEAFSSVSNPRCAHRDLSIEKFTAAASGLKSRFTNDAKTKTLCQELISVMGVDTEKTYFDLP